MVKSACSPSGLLSIWVNAVRHCRIDCCRLFVLWGLLGLLVLPCSSAVAADAIVERAFLEDASGSLQWSEVRSGAQAGNFKPFSGLLNRGYSNSAFWIRLKINPSSEVLGAAYVLRIQPAYLDEISLHDPLDLRASARLVGDRQPIAENGFHSLNHNLLIPATDQPREVWLRLKTSSSSLLHVEALPISEAVRKDGLQFLLLGIYIGALLLFFVWSLIQWAKQPEATSRTFAVNQLIFLLFALSVLGYFRFMLAEYVPAAWLDQLTNVLALASVAASLVFNLNLIDEFDPVPLWRYLLVAMLCLFPVGLLLLLLGATGAAMQVNMLAVAVLPVMMIFTVLSCRAWKPPVKSMPVLPRGALLFPPVLAALFLSAVSLPSMGLAAGTELTLSFNSIYGLFSGLVMVLLLHFRSQRMHQRHLEGLQSLSRAQLQAMQEKKSRQEQVQFMAMLTHELKTPLSVVRMVLGSTQDSKMLRSRADQAVQDISDVIDRWAWIDRFDEVDAALDIAEFDFSAEVDRLASASNADGRLLRLQAGSNFTIKSDLRRVRTILSNLIDNAMKYSLAGSRIELEVAPQLRAQALNLVIEIRNLPGHAGWPEPARVFEKYYRSNGARHQSGSGLGLYQAARIARQLGGDLSLAPDQHFVKFQLWLPC